MEARILLPEITFDARTWNAPDAVPGPAFLADLRKFGQTFKPRTRRKQVRLRKRHNQAWRHTRWLLSRARRGKGNHFYSRLHLSKVVTAVVTGLKP